jgi:hypothetical protein
MPFFPTSPSAPFTDLRRFGEFFRTDYDSSLQNTKNHRTISRRQQHPQKPHPQTTNSENREIYGLIHAEAKAA